MEKQNISLLIKNIKEIIYSNKENLTNIVNSFDSSLVSIPLETGELKEEFITKIRKIITEYIETKTEYKESN